MGEQSASPKLSTVLHQPFRRPRAPYRQPLGLLEDVLRRTLRLLRQARGLVRALASDLTMRRLGAEGRLLRAEAGSMPASHGAVALYAHFSPNRQVSRMVLAQLREYAGLGFHVVFVASGAVLDEASWREVRAVVGYAIQRRNFGLDFGAWADALQQCPLELAELRELLLVNDSMLGPIRPLRPIFDTFRAQPAGLFGLTEGVQHGAHLQSYFLLARGPAATADVVAFLRRMRLSTLKDTIIRRGELGLSRHMRARGHHLSALCGYNDVEKAALASPDEAAKLMAAQPFLAKVPTLPGTARELAMQRLLFDYPLNPTYDLAMLLLRHCNFPFIKARVVLSNPTRLAEALEWRASVGEDSLCSVGMLEEHLLLQQQPLWRRPLAVAAVTEPADHAGPDNAPPDLVMMVGLEQGESARYRVFNVRDALQCLGYRVAVLRREQVRLALDAASPPQALVLFRQALDDELATMIGHARKRGVRCVMDVDDLIFEPGIVDEIAGYRLLPPEEQLLYRDGVARYRAMMLTCGQAIVPTHSLAEAARAIGVPAQVVPNSLNAAQLDRAADLLAQERPDRATVVIGYFSGSRTHNRDFLAAQAGLLALLAEMPQARLLLVGDLDLEPVWRSLGERITRLPVMHHLDMLRHLRDCDINLAPLETGSAFCEAKSELKWFEAALVEVPTIASPTAPYRGAIDHGETGMLAADDEEWLVALRRLANDRDLRERMGRAARQAALAGFGPAELGVRAEAALGLRPRLGAALRNAAPAPEAAASVPMRVDFVIPPLVIGGGGHRNIFRLATQLQARGHDVGLNVLDTEATAAAVRRSIERHFGYAFHGAIRCNPAGLRRTDIAVATHWSTVPAVVEARGRAELGVYFVQDYEPFFYPMGSDHLLAENTYRHGLYCITAGPWCRNLLAERFDIEADYIDFPIDRKIYRPRARRRGPTNLLFFAKPEMPRRCFELGLASLRLLHRMRPDVEIRLFGSNLVEPGMLGFPAVLHGVVTDLAALAQMYADANVGLAFSTTNPSFVPYEMMACGLPVVDIRLPGNEANYGDSAEVALLAGPEPEGIATAMARLLDDEQERRRRRDAGLALLDRWPTEAETSQRFEALLRQRLAAGTRSSALMLA